MTVITFPGRYVEPPCDTDPPVEPITPEDVAIANMEIAIELSMEVAGLRVTANHLENMAKLIHFTMQIGGE